jgi:hypothetical protein
MEDIEDCCLELTDLPFGFYISEYKTGITTKIINTVNRYDYNRRPRWNDTKIPNAESSYIQLVGEVLNERLSLVTKGVWTGKIESLKIQKFNSHRMFKYDENTTIEELSKLEGGKYIKVILETLPSVLSKLTKFVIGEGKEIEFMINMYEVERGSCIVILIEFR